MFHIQNFGKLNWIDVKSQKTSATIFPGIYYVFEPLSNAIVMSYRNEIKVLEISVFLLYKIPDPVVNPTFPIPISTNYRISDIWVPSRSKFTFFDNKIVPNKEYGSIMFG